VFRNHGRVGLVRVLSTLVFVGTALLVGCADEGAAEKAGKKVDEAVEELKHGDEGTLEKAGRKADDALDEIKTSMKKEKEKE